MKYPEVITDDVLSKMTRVSDDEIARDIADTEAEIASLEKEIDGHRLIADANPSSPQGKMAYFLSTGKQSDIDRRRYFVKFLKALQAARVAAAGNRPYPFWLIKNQFDGCISE